MLQLSPAGSVFQFDNGKNYNYQIFSLPIAIAQESYRMMPDHFLLDGRSGLGTRIAILTTQKWQAVLMRFIALIMYQYLD